MAPSPHSRGDVLSFLDALNNVVWGPVTLWLIGLTGLYLMLGLRFPAGHRLDPQQQGGRGCECL